MRYLTSADKPVAEQFSYWREVICQVCTPLAAERKPEHRGGEPTEQGHAGWARSAELMTTHCAEVCSRTQSLTHGPAELRRTVADDVFVHLQVRGDCVGLQADRTCRIPPGGFAMFDTTEPYRLDLVGDDRGDWQVISFRVPRSRLVPMLADPGGFTAVTHAGAGLADLVTGTMTAVWRDIESFDRPAAAAAESAFLSLLAAAADSDVRPVTSRRTEVDAALRASVNRYLAANLRDGDLSVAAVAQGFRISTRKLHNLYEDNEHTFAQTVMRLRLAAAARELAAGAADRTLTDIATRWGFCDLSHLNRLFRGRYGCLPSEFRAEASRVPGSGPVDHRGRAAEMINKNW